MGAAALLSDNIYLIPPVIKCGARAASPTKINKLKQNSAFLSSAKWLRLPGSICYIYIILNMIIASISTELLADKETIQLF